MEFIFDLLGGGLEVFGGLFGVMGGIFGFIFSAMGVVFSLIFAIIILVATLICRAIIFYKMGEPVIYSIIPIYNKWVLFRNTLGSGLWSLLLFVPVISYLISILYSLELAKVFGKSELLGVVLFIFPTVGEAIIAFSGAEYQGLRDYNYLDEVIGLFRR